MNQKIVAGKIGMLLSGITILVACGGWAIIIDWRLGLVSIALLPALVVGMMFQVREDINEKKTFSFGHCPDEGGGGSPMPGFFGPLFFTK